MKPNAALIVVLVALLLAAALRIPTAGDFPVWTDEGWSIWAAQAHVIDVVAADRHPPLYFAALTVWRAVVGDSHLALRFLSIAAGLLTVAVTYRLATDGFGRRAGVIAAFGIAALPSAVYYAQEIRHYGFLTLFAALSWLFLLRWMKEKTPNVDANFRGGDPLGRPHTESPARRLIWLAYTLSITASLYTLYFAVFPLFAQGVAVLIWHAPIRRKLGVLAAWIAAGVLYLPWVYVILTRQAGILQSGIAGFPGSFRAPDDFGAMLAILVGVGLFGLIGVIGLIGRGLQRRLSSAGLALVIGGVGLFALMFTLSLQYQFLAPRTLIMLAPLMVAAVAGGLASLRRVGDVIAVVWVGAMLITPVVIQPRLNSDEAAAVVAAGYRAGDAVILETGWDDNAFAYEVAQALPDDAVIVRTLDWTNDRTGGDPVVPNVMPILEAHDRVWVIQWLQAPSVLPFLEGGGAGFAYVSSEDVSAGEYGAGFGAPIIQVRLFAR